MKRFEKNVEGVVKKFISDKGYGFAVDQSGQDYFVHITDTDGEQAPGRGDRILFDSYLTERGFRARRVRIQERGVADIPETLRRAEPGDKAHLAGPAPKEEPEGERELTVTEKDDLDYAAAQKEKKPEYRNGKLKCSGCDQWVKPRIVTGPPKNADKKPGPWTPVPLYSMCPNCATTLDTFDSDTEQNDAEIVWFVLVAIIILMMFGAITGSR